MKQKPKILIRVKAPENGRVSTALDVLDISLDGLSIVHAVTRVAVIWEKEKITRVELTLLSSDVQIEGDSTVHLSVEHLSHLEDASGLASRYTENVVTVPGCSIDG